MHPSLPLLEAEAQARFGIPSLRPAQRALIDGARRDTFERGPVVAEAGDRSWRGAARFRRMEPFRGAGRHRPSNRDKVSVLAQRRLPARGWSWVGASLNTL